MKRASKSAAMATRSGEMVTRSGEAVLLQWASETGAHGMPMPRDLEQMGWHRAAEHPLFEGTWLMETPEAAPVRTLAAAPGRLRPRTARAR